MTLQRLPADAPDWGLCAQCGDLLQRDLNAPPGAPGLVCPDGHRRPYPADIEARLLGAPKLPGLE